MEWQVYIHFNKFDQASDAEYFGFVDWLKCITISELRRAKGNPHEEKQACCRYYKRGYQADLSTGELIDFLGVSHPSILEMAGYSRVEIDIFFTMSDALTEEEIRVTNLYPEQLNLEL